MQLTIGVGLAQRIVYGCELYSGQMQSGDEYDQLNSVYSICLIDGILWKDGTKVHHRFQLCDRATGRTLQDTLEIHTLKQISSRRVT